MPSAIASVLQACPLDFLYGSIAADTSFAKKYAPVGRHSHAWHVGQEIADLAGSASQHAFGVGYLAHLAADVVAHNFFVPRQLLLTSSTRSASEPIGVLDVFVKNLEGFEMFHKVEALAGPGPGAPVSDFLDSAGCRADLI